MRVKPGCRYRDFKSHVPAAARTNWKRVAAQHRHVVRKFVVAAMHDFVDTGKDRFFTRVKLLHQWSGSSSQTTSWGPPGDRGALPELATQQRRVLSQRPILTLPRLVPQRQFHAVADTDLIVDRADVIPYHVCGNPQFRRNLTILEALRNEFSDPMLSRTESPFVVEK